MIKLFENLKIEARIGKDIDKTILFSMILIVLYGTFNIYMCTKGGKYAGCGPKQLVWFLISLVILYLFLTVDYSIIMNYVSLFYWGSIMLLIGTKIFGSIVNGAKGWIRFGPISLQASEIAKIAIILMLAKLLDEMEGKINEVKNFFTLVLYCVVPVGFILKQPDMGMAMVCFFIVLGIFFVEGLNIKVILGGLTSLVFGIIIVWNSGLIEQYQKNRIISFLDSSSDETGAGYHLVQSLIGIGSGGLFGSRPSITSEMAMGYSAQNVPEVHTDFIFAAIAEQWGFIGAMILLTLYAMMIYRMIVIARTARDTFGSVICVGMVSYFLFAVIQNIGMTIGIMPITGITLPLVSYGGSSLLTTILSIGLVLNIGMRRKKIHF